MLAFLDESGDPGLNPDRRSSPYFIVALTVFQEDHEAQVTDDRIHELRAELGFHPRFEFRFNKASRDLRLRFLTRLRDHSFRYYGFVIDKRKLRERRMEPNGPLHHYASRMVLADAAGGFSRATVVIDGSGSRESRRSLGRYLRRSVNAEREVIRKIKVQDSRQNDLLQLADMVVGATARSFSDKTDANDYRDVIRRQEAQVRIWPT